MPPCEAAYQRLHMIRNLTEYQIATRKLKKQRTEIARLRRSAQIMGVSSARVGEYLAEALEACRTLERQMQDFAARSSILSAHTYP